MSHYTEETTETTNTENENQSAETVTTPTATTEDGDEIIKPGGKKEKNPKKNR